MPSSDSCSNISESGTLCREKRPEEQRPRIVAHRSMMLLCTATHAQESSLFFPKSSPTKFDSPGRIFRAGRTKQQSTSQQPLRCSCPVHRNKGKHLFAPCNFEQYSPRSEKKLGVFPFCRGHFDGKAPINRKTPAMDVRGILDFQNRSTNDHSLFISSHP